MVMRTAKDIMEEEIKDLSLDSFLNRNPSTLKWPDDFKEIVARERSKRAMFIKSQADKKAKQQEAEDE